MGSYSFFTRRRMRKKVREILRQARHLRNMREDILADSDLQRLDSAEQRVRALLAQRRYDELEPGAQDLYQCLVDLNPRERWAGLKENFEIMVVAVAVAMGFRTYFFQPFKIPTGSMEPTLRGIHIYEFKAGEAPAPPTILDRWPLKALKWIVTGGWYTEVRARNSGSFASATRQDRLDHDTRQICYVGTRRYSLPRGATPMFEDGDFVRKGDILWAGITTSGDHVFVDKVRWNFRAPQRSEVIVFRMDSIDIVPQVPPGTHYIKRLIGMPNERISIRQPSLIVNGERIRDPRYRAQQRLVGEDFPEYRGFLEDFPEYRGVKDFRAPNVTTEHPLRYSHDSIQLQNGQYHVLGDNAASSLDSRYWGVVPEENLVGPAVIVYWPFSRRWGTIR